MNEILRDELLLALRHLRDFPEQDEVLAHCWGMLFDALVFTPVEEITPGMEREFEEMTRRVTRDPDRISARTFILKHLEEVGFHWFRVPA